MLFDCRPKVLHKHCLQFLLGVKMAPRETENNAYAKFWGDKQRTLWYVMVFLEWSIEGNHFLAKWVTISTAYLQLLCANTWPHFVLQRSRRKTYTYNQNRSKGGTYREYFYHLLDENYANVAVTLTSTGVTCIFCSNSCWKTVILTEDNQHYSLF